MLTNNVFILNSSDENNKPLLSKTIKFQNIALKTTLSLKHNNYKRNNWKEKHGENWLKTYISILFDSFATNVLRVVFIEILLYRIRNFSCIWFILCSTLMFETAKHKQPSTLLSRLSELFCRVLLRNSYYTILMRVTWRSKETTIEDNIQNIT